MQTASSGSIFNLAALAQGPTGDFVESSSVRQDGRHRRIRFFAAGARARTCIATTSLFFSTLPEIQLLHRLCTVRLMLELVLDYVEEGFCCPSRIDQNECATELQFHGGRHQATSYILADLEWLACKMVRYQPGRDTL